MRSLGLAAASCFVNYAAGNSNGNDDNRLPWPAPVDLGDYRDDSSFDDADNGSYPGRLPDIVDDSNAATGNSIARALSDCDPVAVPEWSAASLARWQHWKDHFFYAVAGSFSPGASVPTNCGSCLSVNGGGQYAAVIIFSNRRLDTLGQVRDAPPLDAETKDDVVNYLEEDNAANIPGSDAAPDYTSQAATSSFNDLMFCIDKNLNVTEC